MKSKKNGEIEFYRFLFAILIMLRHGKHLMPDFRFAPVLSRASIGVEFFFFVSGYLMAKSAAKMQAEGTGRIAARTGKFVLKKYTALMPEFAFAVLISFTLACIRGHVTAPAAILKKAWVWLWELIPLSMLGFTGGQFHMGAWYISAMLLGMLLLFPLCLKWFRLYTRVLAPVIAIVILTVIQIKFKTPLGPSTPMGGFYKGLYRAFAELSAGAAIFPLVEAVRQKNLQKRDQLVITAAVAMLTVLIFAYAFYAKRAYRKYDIVCAGLILVLVALLFCHKGILSERFDNRLCIWLGDLSLLIYLCHVEYAKSVDDWMTAVFGQNPSLRQQLLFFGLYFAGTAAIVAVVKILSNGLRRLCKPAART